MAEHIDNIGERGARVRRHIGWISTALTVVTVVVLVAAHASRAARLLVALPVGLAAIGFLQAREKTCVTLAALGQCEANDGRSSRTPSARERAAARRQALGIVARATLIAAIAAAIAWVV